MDREEPEAEGRHTVVVNREQQYSLWPEGKPLPKGWSDAGRTGTRAECLAYIKEVWTDMRPASLRSPANGSTTSA
jgi:MbtH protein